MATRYIDKVGALAEIRNLPDATGIGVFGGQVYVNLNGSIGPLGGRPFGNMLLVDGDNGSDTNTSLPYATIQAAVTAASDGDTILIAPKTMAAGATDPSNYAETIIIPAAKTLALIGVSNGRAQGAQPQIKKGSGSTALLTVRSPGCLIANLSFNGGSSTGGGILLDDDGSTKSAFGTVIAHCFFKNCVGSTATSAKTGGAIQWSSAGGAWQVHIVGNRFYKNVGDIVLIGTTGSVPQDVVIEENVFSGPAASVDCNLYLAGGSGMNGVIVKDNVFSGSLPALSSGAVVRFIDATGCIGSTLSGNTFSDTGKTFGATGDGAKIPTTMFMARNYQEKATSGSGEIFRTA